MCIRDRTQSGHEGKFLVHEIEDTHQRVFVGDAGDAVLFDTKYVSCLSCTFVCSETAAHSNPGDYFDTACPSYLESRPSLLVCCLQDVAQSAAKPVWLTAGVLYHPLLTFQHAPSRSADSGHQAAEGKRSIRPGFAKPAAAAWGSTNRW